MKSKLSVRVRPDHLEKLKAKGKHSAEASYILECVLDGLYPCPDCGYAHPVHGTKARKA